MLYLQSSFSYNAFLHPSIYPQFHRCLSIYLSSHTRLLTLIKSPRLPILSSNQILSSNFTSPTPSADLNLFKTRYVTRIKGPSRHLVPHPGSLTNFSVSILPQYAATNCLIPANSVYSELQEAALLWTSRQCQFKFGTYDVMRDEI